MGAKASEALGLTAQALKFCEGGLNIAPGDKEMKQLHKRLLQALEREEEGRSKDKRLADQAAQARGYADAEAAQMLGERGVTLGPQLYDMAMYAREKPSKPKLTDDGTAVQWSLLFL